MLEIKHNLYTVVITVDFWLLIISTKGRQSIRSFNETVDKIY